MKKCPYCAEEIKDEAIKRRWCGEFLPPPIIPRAEAVMTSSDGWIEANPGPTRVLTILKMLLSNPAK